MPLTVRHPRIPFFRIFYSTTFTLLTLLLLALLLITPGDQIYQAFRRHQFYHIVVVACVYLLTLIIALFIYAGRLFQTRSSLARIPWQWDLSGGKNGDLGVGLGMGRRVGRVVRQSLERSAVISLEARPRDLRDEKMRRQIPARRKRGVSGGKTAKGERKDVASNTEPVWGIISHPGWSGPASEDLPNLHFETVILELPHLIEAKAVSLAPRLLNHADGEPAKEQEEGVAEPEPDAFAVELLQRPATMGLRDYISHLIALGMVTPESPTSAFLTLYERARFSGKQLHEEEFRALMGLFAECLRNLQPLDSAIIDEMHANTAEVLESSVSSGNSSNSITDSKSLSSQGTVEHHPQPSASTVYNTTPSSSSISSEKATTHTRPRATRQASHASKASNASQITNASILHQRSLTSLRKTRSNSGRSYRSTAGSVIRLADAAGPLDLPYAFVGGGGDGDGLGEVV